MTTLNYSDPINELDLALRRALSTQGSPAEIRMDLATRILYSTDASIYQIEPVGVVFPRTRDDLAAVVEISTSYGVPLVPRGAGSGLAGQAIGSGLIVDCSRYLNKIIEINPEVNTATVEPGVVLSDLNQACARYGLQFGPDPASSERATLGGVLANNATGAHSIRFGMSADHLLEADVILSDGSAATLECLDLAEVVHRASTLTGIEGNLYRTALTIRTEHAEAIRRNWPRTWRRASGYNLNYLLPWSPSSPPLWDWKRSQLGTVSRQLIESGEIPGNRGPYPPVSDGSLNLAVLFCGSEGTLAVLREAKVNLVSLPKHSILGLLAFSSLPAACEAVPALLAHSPAAIELIPRALIRLASSVPAYARQLSFLQQFEGGDPAALLVVEFSGAGKKLLREQALSLGPGVRLAESEEEKRNVWGVRKVGLGLLMSRAGDFKPWPFIEDLSVPVDSLGEFVAEMERILAAHRTQGDFYAHASAGCLHIRPLVNLKTVQGVAVMRAIASQAVSLTLSLGGSISGEHGDGLSRSEWLERMFGQEVIAAFRELKEAADPRWLLNPGKIVSPQGWKELPRMDTNLRFGSGYQAQVWTPKLDFNAQDGLDGAIEQCNGAGVCRKSDGVMCPSFQASQDEMHSTRGRANLMRAMITGRFPTHRIAQSAVYQALDLCLACKGCKAECPSAVDMAKLKYEFLSAYHQSPLWSDRRRKLRDYLFAYIGPLAKIGSPFAPLVNPLLRKPTSLGSTIKRLIGLAPQRVFPEIKRRTFSRQARASLHKRNASISQYNPEAVILLVDAFTEYFRPQAGLDTLQVLSAAGCDIHLLNIIGAGRTLISKGFLEAAKEHAARLVDAVYTLDPQARMPILGLEPSEIYTLRDEYLDLLPGDRRVQQLAERAWMVDEFLIRPGPQGATRISTVFNHSQRDIPTREKDVLLHGHCYQKAQPPAADGFPVGVSATKTMLKTAGYKVLVIEAGCCGMAGAFGYETEHYQLSMQIGELKLFPEVRSAGKNRIVAASGISCQEQILDGSGEQAIHPVSLVL